PAAWRRSRRWPSWEVRKAWPGFAPWHQRTGRIRFAPPPSRGWPRSTFPKQPPWPQRCCANRPAPAETRPRCSPVSCSSPAARPAALKKESPSADAARVGLRLVHGSGVPAPELVGILRAANGEIGRARQLDAKEMQRFLALAQSQGDAARGEAVFRRPALGC